MYFLINSSSLRFEAPMSASSMFCATLAVALSIMLLAESNQSEEAKSPRITMPNDAPHSVLPMPHKAPQSPTNPYKSYSSTPQIPTSPHKAHSTAPQIPQAPQGPQHCPAQGSTRRNEKHHQRPISPDNAS